MYEDILVPTDGSEGAANAIDEAIDMALAFDAALHTVYVTDTSGLSRTRGAPGALEELKSHGRDAVQSVIDQAEAAGVETIEATVATGAPHEAILKYVEDHGIDLVIMGTHGRTGLRRYLLGSVTERVVRASPVPVLTVGMADRV